MSKTPEGLFPWQAVFNLTIHATAGELVIPQVWPGEGVYRGADDKHIRLPRLTAAVGHLPLEHFKHG